jgi:predicted kinase
MPKMIMLVGLPGSGKTTYLERFPEDAVRLSLDDFRWLMTGKEFHLPFEPVAIGWVESTGRYLMSQGYSILIDATSLRRGLRAKWVRMAQEFGHKTKAIWLDTPYFTCLERNEARERKVPEDVIQRMSESFEEPTEEEGFDEIVRVKEE